MPGRTDYLAAAQATIPVIARQVILEYRLAPPGYRVSATEMPESVRAAEAFHNSILDLPSGPVGEVLVHRLPPEMGSGFMVLAHHSESRWGLTEIYSPDGELWAAGVYLAFAVAWHPLEAVREASTKLDPPYLLIPQRAPLDWIELGTGDMTAYESVGGRFLIMPPDPTFGPQCFVMRDGLRKTNTEFDTPDAAKAHANVLVANT